MALISHESYNFQQSLRHLQDGLRPLRVRRRPLLRTLLNVKTTKSNLNNFMFHFPISQAVDTLYSTLTSSSIRNIYSRHGFAQLQVLLRPRPDERVVETLSGGHRGRIEVARELEKENQNHMRKKLSRLLSSVVRNRVS